MTRTDWIVNVLIPQREAVAEIENPPPEIDDILAQIQQEGYVRTSR